MATFDTSDVEMFDGSLASPLVQTVVDKFFATLVREPDPIENWKSKKRIDECSLLGELVKSRLKERAGWWRYKFIVQTMIGQNSALACQVGYAAFWDEETDGMASAVYHDDDICCVVSVFAIYIY